MLGGIFLWLWSLSTPSLLLLSLLALLGYKALDLLWWRPKRVEEHFARQGVTGPPYRFFIGNVREMVGHMLKASSHTLTPPSHNILPRVLPFYHHWKKIYGSTFLLWFGPTARLAVADPDLIREIFVSKSEFYERYESHPLVRQLEGEGLVSLRGEKWAHHRKTISPTFHMENLKLFMPLMASSVLDMLDKWSSKMSGDDCEVEIDVSEWYQSLTEEAITRTAFGISYEDGKMIFQLQAQQMAFAAEAFRNVFIPGYRFIPTKKNTSSWRLDKEIKTSLTKLIDGRKQGSGDGGREGGEKPKDLMGLLIDANGRGSDGGRSADTEITVHDIVEECKTFFFAGKQTTSNLLTWTTVLLSMHPEWQSLARAEVLHVCGSRDVPSRDQLAKLKTLGMILNESLRLYPPAVATIRRAKQDTMLGRYRIPMETELLIPIIAVHHDTALWGQDAHEFNPARFADGAARAARHPTAFMPFGLGARTCIGQNLAVLQAKLTMTLLLQRFSFKLGPGYQHAPTVLMLLYPQYGAPIVFRRLRAGPEAQPDL
ncbi:Cytochrome P450 [Acorus gramineus]|uniref:Cytochrome P450 n=1 Tax=Acorus gramineus TaxID=55184 RepID=A0AAV9AN20_ACOGR|nr:Cytochrome P450 [Acorus gramineus]